MLLCIFRRKHSGKYMQLPLFGRMNNLQIPCSSWYKCFSKKEIKMWREMLFWWADYKKLNKCIVVQHLNRTQILSLWLSVLMQFVFYRHTVCGTMKNEINFPSLKHLIIHLKVPELHLCQVHAILILEGRTEINSHPLQK